MNAVCKADVGGARNASTAVFCTGETRREIAKVRLLFEMDQEGMTTGSRVSRAQRSASRKLMQAAKRLR